MSTRNRQRAPESLIVEYFMTADAQNAQTLYRVVRGILDQRGDVFTTTKTPEGRQRLSTRGPRRVSGGVAPAPPPEP